MTYVGFEHPGVISKRLFGCLQRLTDEVCWASLADPPDPVSLRGKIDATIGIHLVAPMARFFYSIKL